MAKRFGWGGMAAAGLGSVLLLAACGGANTNQLSGAVVIRSLDDIAFGEAGGDPVCAGAVNSGYGDIVGGEDVFVADGSGEELARTTLGVGQPSADGTECTFPWEIAELPETNGYLIAVGGREPVPYTLEELRRDDFTIDLVLADPGA